MPSHTDRVAITGQSDPGREVAGVFLGRPHSVRRYDDRREAEPFRAGSAVDIPIKPGMIRKDLQTASDEQDQEKKLR